MSSLLFTSASRPTAAAANNLSRSELTAALLLVGFANALLPQIMNGFSSDGFVYAVSNTFEISAIVWLALFFSARFALAAESSPILLQERVVAIVFVGFSLLPVGPALWIVLSLYGLYLICDPRNSDLIHRAGWLCLATTVPLFWSKRVFAFFSEYLLAADAYLVSCITGTSRTANLVAIPNGHGYLSIAPGCSSMANVSLALLCWTVFTQVTGVKWRPSNIAWCAAACLSVVCINVVRISMIGFYPEKYSLIHGPVGATIVSWIIVFDVVAISYYGVRRGGVKSV